jgi:hypothetical protein
MKRLSILLITFFIVTRISAQRIWDGPVTGGSWATATNWSGDVVPAPNEIVIFPTGISGTISNVNGGNNITLGGLIVQGSSNITLTNSANRTITIANGAGAVDFHIEVGAALTISANVDLTLAAGTATNNTTATIAGTFSISASRTFDTNNGNVLSTVAGTIENYGTVAGNIARLLFLNGSVYNHARAGGSIPAATWSSNSTCRLTGLTNGDPGNDNQAFGNLIYDCANMSGATRNLGANGLTIAGNLEIINTGTAALRLGLNDLAVTGNLSITGGTLRIGDNTNRTLTVSGNVSVEGGTLQMSTGNNAADRGTLNVAGNFSQNGGAITETSAGRGTINFTGNTIQFFSKNIAAIISNNIDFNINAGATVDFGTSVLNGSTGTFTLNDNGKLITANNNGFNGNGGNNGTIQVTGTTTYSSLADYEFKGTATGQFTTTANPQVRNFIVNNTAGTVTLSQPVTVNGILTLTAGPLTTSSVNLLTISATGSATAATNSSFVNGPMAKQFAAPITGFTFPVGKAGTGYRNIGITAPSAASTFRAEFFRAVPPAGILGTGITRLSACEYWDLTRTAGVVGTSTRVILSWTNNSPCSAGPYVTEQTTLKVAHLTAGAWVNEGYLASTGNPGAGTITSGNLLTSFSPFALAGNGPADNPLAVSFDNVKAYSKDNGVQIEWSNLTEKDIALYFVERSANGIDFTSINQQLPLSNQNDKANYTMYDANPVSGINFYRIKVRETSGQIFYSKVLSVELTRNKKGLNIYPNPVSGNKITISLSGIKKGQYNFQITNMTGQVVVRQILFSPGTSLTQVLDLPATLKPGMYSMIVSGEGYRESKSFLCQQ